MSQILKRLRESLAALFFLITITFFLLRLMPGGPFDTEYAFPPEVKTHFEEKFHLNEPLWKQYFTYLKTISTGDLGVSMAYQDQEIGQMIRSTLPVTLLLGFLSLLLSILIGVPAGLVAARKRNTWIDRAVMLIAVAGVSVPSFLVAPVLILIFSFWLDWLPPALWESPKYFILPVVTLGVRPAALIARLTRASALDVIHSDFVRSARAKGAKESVVLFKHVLKNSLIPLLGIAGPLVANVLSGSFVVEAMYAIPGLGHHYVESVTNRDYPLIMSMTVLYCVILTSATFIADAVTAMIDPRVKTSADAS